MPPPGVTPDFDNPDNYKHQNIILHSVVLSFATVAVLVRLYTRAVVKRSFGIDDWFALLSWALALEFSIVMAYATMWGFGMHIYDIRASEILNTMKWLAASQKSYFPLILSIKLCILLGYLRVFKTDRGTNWGIWIGLATCSIFYIVTFFIDVFRCKPVEAAWNPAVNGTCLSYAAFPWATGVFNVVSDFYILLLPLPIIFKMHMPLARRLRIASIFGLGTFVLEANIGLICGCAIAFPAFFDASAPRSLGSLVGSLLAKASASQTSILSPPRSRKDAEGGLRLSEGSPSQSKSRWGKLSRPSKQNIYNEMAEDRNLTG
ncbi:hypothetical protein SLS64_011566 [Diaporthe eres]|uniref:Rhodopsin domain-containing protein n=1 Tax=Diaporthe eres TaxID=83184 RepID=A0ABR1P044_DIAER